MPAPCIKMMGLDPADVPDKVLSELADSVQRTIKAVISARSVENGKPKKKKKK